MELKEVESILLTSKRATHQIKPGKIIKTDFGLFLVAVVEKRDDGWAILDHFNSGYTQVDENREWDVVRHVCYNPTSLRYVMERRAEQAKEAKELLNAG